MRKILILLTSMFLLVGCMESVAVIGGAAQSGNALQSSLQSGVSYGVKKTTGKSPLGHAINLVKKKKISEKKDLCSSFVNKKALEICLMVEKRIISQQAEIPEKETSNGLSNEIISLQSSINKKSKIKYLNK